MVPDTKPGPSFVGCVECGHDRSRHFCSDVRRVWTDEEWEIEMKGTWDKGRCQWDSDDKNTCPCMAFKHPDAPRRREAIEHSRRLGL